MARKPSTPVHSAPDNIGGFVILAPTLFIAIYVY